MKLKIIETETNNNKECIRRFTKFIALNHFEAYIPIFDESGIYEYYVNSVKNKVEITNTLNKYDISNLEIDFRDFKLPMNTIYTIPRLTKMYAQTYGNNIYYQLFIWITETKALLLHSNTSWDNVSYFQEYDIRNDLNVKNPEKRIVSRQTDITDYINNADRIYFDTKDTYTVFNDITSYMATILKQISSNKITPPDEDDR